MLDRKMKNTVWGNYAKTSVGVPYLPLAGVPYLPCLPELQWVSLVCFLAGVPYLLWNRLYRGTSAGVPCLSLVRLCCQLTVPDHIRARGLQLNSLCSGKWQP